MEGAETQPARTMTADEFLAWDGGGHVGKLELVHGEVRAMSPASGTHALIQGTLTGLIGQAIRTRKLKYWTAIRPPIKSTTCDYDDVRAPDIGVTGTCASGLFFPSPILAIEIAEGSEGHAARDNMRALMAIPTIAEFAMVDAECIHVEVFRRADDGSWPKDGEVSEAGGSVRLESILAEFSLTEIYEGTLLS